MVRQLKYKYGSKGVIDLPRGAPFDGEPVLVKLASGWVEARWEPASVSHTQDGPEYEGFCWVVLDDSVEQCDLEDVKYWTKLPRIGWWLRFREWWDHQWEELLFRG